MAAFIAKQMVGNQLKSVKGALGDEKEGENKDEEEGEDPEIEEARREAEEKRKDKHRKMEEEREEMRQSIRDKYGLKKKDPEAEANKMLMETEGRIGRKKKTPAELAAEANEESEEEDEFAMGSGIAESVKKQVESGLEPCLLKAYFMMDPNGDSDLRKCSDKHSKEVPVDILRHHAELL